VREIRLMNRSLERAVQLAGEYRAAALSLEALPAQLEAVDIIISSVSAPSYLLERPRVAAAMRARRQRPLCLIDLGVPRNVDPATGALENVYLFDIDSLQELLQRHNAKRQEAVSHSQQILDRKVELFLSWWREDLAHALADRDRHAG
jgi:glutamyl-tRNA reductase